MSAQYSQADWKLDAGTGVGQTPAQRERAWTWLPAGWPFGDPLHLPLSEVKRCRTGEGGLTQGLFSSRPLILLCVFNLHVGQEQKPVVKWFLQYNSWPITFWFWCDQWFFFSYVFCSLTAPEGNDCSLLKYSTMFISRLLTLPLLH